MEPLGTGVYRVWARAFRFVQSSVGSDIDGIWGVWLGGVGVDSFNMLSLISRSGPLGFRV